MPYLIIENPLVAFGLNQNNSWPAILFLISLPHSENKLAEPSVSINRILNLRAISQKRRVASSGIPRIVIIKSKNQKFGDNKYLL
jgi:hypothetical protein